MSFKNALLPVITTLFVAGAITAQAQDDDDSAGMEEVVVRGIRAADMNAREAERMKDIFSSVISQDDVGNFADQNVAEALQRLPGITLQKNDGQAEFVNLRGLGPGFVGVTIDDSELASASSNGRAVGLNAIPADLMGSIEVFKSLTPDMDLNAIAGKVNVKSINAFDRGRDSLKLTVQGSEHGQRGEFSPKATLIGTKLLADDTIGLAASLSYEDRSTDINQISAEGDDVLKYIRLSQPYIGENDPNVVLSRLPALSSTQYMLSGQVDPYIDSPRMLIPEQFENRQDQTVRTRIGATLDFGWHPTANSEYFFRYAYTDFTDDELTWRENYRFINGDEHYFIGDVDPSENFFLLSNTDLRHRVAIEKYTEITDDYSIGGENTFGNWAFDYEYHISNSERENPDDRRVQFRIRALPMYGQVYKNDIRAAIVSQTQYQQLIDTSGATDYDLRGIGGMNGFQSGFAEGVEGYQLGARRQPNMAYDEILLEAGTRTDELDSIKFNVRKEFTKTRILNLMDLNYIKAGFQAKSRERLNLQSQLSVNPGDIGTGGCVNPDGSENRDCLTWYNTSLGRAGFATYTPRFDRFDHDMITLEDAELLMANTRLIPESLDPDRSGASSLDDNYAAYEDTVDVYFMGEFQVADGATLIAGARYVETEYGSVGWLTLRHDRFLKDDGIIRDIAIPLGDPDTGGYAINEYNGVYPGAHLRYEITDDLLFRAAVWTSYSRPGFGDANVSAKFSDRVVLCTDAPVEGRPVCSDNLKDDLGVGDETVQDLDQYVREHFSLAPGGNSLKVGNSDLQPLDSINFDTSLSWYGEGQFFEVAVFYKDIENYIVDVRGIDVARNNLPLAIQRALDQVDVNVNGGADPNRNQNVFAIDPNFVFRDVSTTINGDKATVYGLEATYNKFFNEGLLNGFFLQSNLTLLSSSADAGETVRADETPLPNQADVTANLTVGWENEQYSVRLINNYRSEVLKEIGACSAADIAADAEWAAQNDASNSGALSGATGTGVVYAENCQRYADVFHDDIYSLDFKATYSPWENVKFYLDVLNVTEDVDVFFYRGNEFSGGNLLNFTEGVGRTYQAGVNYTFW